MSDKSAERNCVYYKNVDYSGDRYRVGDCVELFAGENEQPFIGRIERIFREMGHEIKAEIRWLYRWSDIKCKIPEGIQQSDRECLYSFESDLNELVSIERKIKFSFIRSKAETLPNGLFCRYLYDNVSKQIFPLDSDLETRYCYQPKKLRVIGALQFEYYQTPMCHKRKRAQLSVKRPQKFCKHNSRSSVHTNDCASKSPKLESPSRQESPARPRKPVAVVPHMLADKWRLLDQLAKEMVENHVRSDESWSNVKHNVQEWLVKQLERKTGLVLKEIVVTLKNMVNTRYRKHLEASQTTTGASNTKHPRILSFASQEFEKRPPQGSEPSENSNRNSLLSSHEELFAPLPALPEELRTL